MLWLTRLAYARSPDEDGTSAYSPDLLEAIENSFGFSSTEEEQKFLVAARKLLKGKQLSLTSKKQKDAFREFVETLAEK